MANNYQQSSSFLHVPEEQKFKAKTIVFEEIDRITEQFEYCGCLVEFEHNGLWFYGEEYCDVQHVEQIARAVIEELELDKPFFCSWAYTCDKPRIDEFGGGAFVIVRGKDTYWVDAMTKAMDFADNIKSVKVR
jgi:hypothetical protein